jgi:hypothetical protein
MAKRKGHKDKQHNGQKKRTFLLAIMLLVLLSFSFGHCVACPVIFFWSLCCLSFCHFLFTIVLLVLLSLFGQKKGTEGQEKQWPKEKDRRTSNTMAKRKERERQATQ